MLVREEQSFNSLRESLGIEQANAVSSYINVKLEMVRETSATKQDLTDLQVATKDDIKQFRHEMSEFKSAVKYDIAELKASTQHDIAELKASTQQDIASLRFEMKDQHKTLISDFRLIVSDLKNEITSVKADILRWLVATILAVFALAIAVMKMF